MFSQIKGYCRGKKNLVLDELILSLDLVPTADTRRKVAEYLAEIGWVREGRKRVEGKIRSVWGRASGKERTEMEIIRLELIDKRQENDVLTIENMLKNGFSHDQCMRYLQMVYNADSDRLDLTEGEHKETEDFASDICDKAGGKEGTIKMMYACAYMFYTEKYFPELVTSDRYMAQIRRVYASLMCNRDDDDRKIEWKALSFFPNFLDMSLKLTDEGESGYFKGWLVESFLTDETVDKLRGSDLYYKMIGAMAVMARKIVRGSSFSKPYGVDKDWALESWEYLTESYNKYGK